MAQNYSRNTEVFLIVLLSMFLLMAYTIFRILPSPKDVQKRFSPPVSDVVPAPQQLP